jgi:hypothetical protein
MNIKISLGMLAALAAELATTDVERDKNGYTPKHERDRLPSITQAYPSPIFSTPQNRKRNSI